MNSGIASPIFVATESLPSLRQLLQESTTRSSSVSNSTVLSTSLPLPPAPPPSSSSPPSPPLLLSQESASSPSSSSSVSAIIGGTNGNNNCCLAFKPMLATPLKQHGDLTDKLGDAREWFVEEKYDGERLLITHTTNDKRQVHQSRFLRDTTLNSVFQHRIHVNAPYRDCVFDGELVFRDWHTDAIVPMCETGERVATQLYATYMIFDVQRCNGNDLRGETLIARKRLLERLVRVSRYVRITEYTEIPTWRDLWVKFDRVLSHGGEGLMLKHKNGTYVSDKRRWLKVKPLHLTGVRDEYELFAHKMLKDKNGMVNIMICGYYRDIDDSESFVKVCSVSSGINGFARNTLQQLIDHTSGYFRERILVTIVADKKTIYGHLRHPVFARLRFDLTERHREYAKIIAKEWTQKVK